MGNFKTYKHKVRAGIDDLSNMYPELAAEWWTQEDWDVWNAGSEQRAENDRKYIAELKRKDTFGEEYELTLQLANNPLTDERVYIKRNAVDSFKFEFLDFGKTINL